MDVFCSGTNIHEKLYGDVCMYHHVRWYDGLLKIFYTISYKLHELLFYVSSS